MAASDPLVPLNSGNGGPPLFIAHGIGGSVSDLIPLAMRLGLNRLVYGLQTRGNDGNEDPLDRIEDMAEYFLDAVRRHKVRGPYLLVGYSLGGLVTLEMAQRLRAEGEQVALLVMLDSYPDRHHLSLTEYARLATRLAKRRVIGWMAPSRTDSNVGSIGDKDSGRTQSVLTESRQPVKEAQYKALRNYRPRFYDGDVKFVRAAIPTNFPANPMPVWAHLVRKFDVETVPGNHLELLTKHVDAVAEIVSRHVREAGGD